MNGIGTLQLDTQRVTILVDHVAVLATISSIGATSGRVTSDRLVDELGSWPTFQTGRNPLCKDGLTRYAERQDLQRKLNEIHSQMRGSGLPRTHAIAVQSSKCGLGSFSYQPPEKSATEIDRESCYLKIEQVAPRFCTEYLPGSFDESVARRRCGHGWDVTLCHTSCLPTNYVGL